MQIIAIQSFWGVQSRIRTSALQLSQMASERSSTEPMKESIGAGENVEVIVVGSSPIGKRKAEDGQFVDRLKLSDHRWSAAKRQAELMKQNQAGQRPRPWVRRTAYRRRSPRRMVSRGCPVQDDRDEADRMVNSCGAHCFSRAQGKALGLQTVASQLQDRQQARNSSSVIGNSSLRDTADPPYSDAQVPGGSATSRGIVPEDGAAARGVLSPSGFGWSRAVRSASRRGDAGTRG